VKKSWAKKSCCKSDKPFVKVVPVLVAQVRHLVSKLLFRLMIVTIVIIVAPPLLFLYMLHLAQTVKPRYMRLFFNRRYLYGECYLFALFCFLAFLIFLLAIYDDIKMFKKRREIPSIDTSELYWTSLVCVVFLMFIFLFAVSIIMDILKYMYLIGLIHYLVYLRITAFSTGLPPYLYLFPPLRELKRVEIFPKCKIR